MDYQQEVEARAAWIAELLHSSGCQGIVLGISGGKDSSIVAALCRRATPKVLGAILPCGSLAKDGSDARHLAEIFAIETTEIDLGPVYLQHLQAIQTACGELTPLAAANLKPRLRMTTLYALAHARGYLVAGTSNRSERVMGYFTKWGDGVSDFNPIADLTVREVLLLGEALGIPDDLLYKPPSAGLWEGQTDEAELGISYAAIDRYLLEGAETVTSAERELIERARRSSEHKRNPIRTFREV
ncbi:MAG: NAD(+) synthase [Symbiobacteriaceae bacterium]|nr:NAD(+) synthase [Symbiobacteriaceae bacterium]